jgi:integrase
MIVSTFFPVGSDIEDIVRDWIGFLRTELLWGPDDALFPRTKIEVGASRYFESNGLDRQHWKSAAAIRGIFRRAFEAAGLPYFNPHAIRSTLAMLGETTCESPEQFKAWSQNLGHEQVLTTLTSYGQVAQHRQDEILNAMANASANTARSVDRPLIAVEPELIQKLERVLTDLGTVRQVDSCGTK